MCKDVLPNAYTELRNLSYKERLNKLNLISLELHRLLQFDLIMCYYVLQNNFGLV